MPKRNPNKGKRWTQKELQEVYSLITEQEYSIKSVAKKYGRTPASVVAKLNKTHDYYIGMTEPSEWDWGKKLSP
tara:strand:- start:1512 stop:1733 length:222 start_codon:yes stop_codon:yes gene_type:complete